FVGGVLDDTTFSFVCSLDEGDDPLTDPSCWIKANPLLGVTMMPERLAEIVAQAKSIPGQLNGILRLHFCVWTDAETAWMARSVVDPCLCQFDPLEEHKGKRVFVGLDLSQNRDLTAKANVVQTGEVESHIVKDGENLTVKKPTFDAWVEAWTPLDTIAARELRDKIPYRVWVDQGHLNAVPGASISYTHVAQSLAEDQQNYEIAIVAYDRYAFKRFE